MRRNSQIATIAVAVLLLATTVAQAGCTRATALEQPGNDQPERTISISGTGTVSAQPDIAVVSLGVETEAREASVALAQNSGRMQALIDVLKEAGVSAENIQTQVVQLRPRYEEPRPEEPGVRSTPRPVGYTATNIVEVRVEDLDMLGALLDTAVRAGGNRIQGIRFELSDPSSSVDMARKAAWEDAKQKGDQLAALADVELGDVLIITESSRRPGPVVRESLGAGGAAAVPIEPGTQAVEVDIQVTWLLH